MIDSQRSKQYILSIRISTDGFSFYVYDPVLDRLILTESREPVISMSLTANLKKIHRETECLGYTYKRVNVIVEGTRYTLVPASLFEPDKTGDYFHYNFPAVNNELLRYNIVDKFGLSVIFAIDRGVYNFMTLQHPNVCFYSQTTVLINRFASLSRQGNNKKIYVYPHKRFISVFCMDNGSLLLVNSFLCETTDDCLYYILYCWKQLGFEQERDEIWMASTPFTPDGLVNELRKYVRHVNLVNNTRESDINPLLECE